MLRQVDENWGFYVRIVLFLNRLTNYASHGWRLELTHLAVGVYESTRTAHMEDVMRYEFYFCASEDNNFWVVHVYVLCDKWAS